MKRTGGKEAARITAKAGEVPDYTQDCVDYAYEALNAHRNSCRVCQDENGQVNKAECDVGLSLAAAWGMAEGYRDDFRDATIPPDRCSS